VSSLGVFDGHHGALTATMAAQRMPEILHGALLGRTAAAAPAAGPRTGETVVGPLVGLGAAGSGGL
jgi:hypothetical protein